MDIIEKPACVREREILIKLLNAMKAMSEEQLERLDYNPDILYAVANLDWEEFKLVYRPVSWDNSIGRTMVDWCLSKARPPKLNDMLPTPRVILKPRGRKAKVVGFTPETKSESV